MCCCFGRKVFRRKSIPAAAAAFYEFGRGVDERRRYAYASTRTLGGAAWWPTSAALRLGSGGSGGGWSASTSAGASFANVSAATSNARPEPSAFRVAARRKRKHRVAAPTDPGEEPSAHREGGSIRSVRRGPILAAEGGGGPVDPPWVDALPGEAGTHRSKLSDRDAARYGGRARAKRRPNRRGQTRTPARVVVVRNVRNVRSNPVSRDRTEGGRVRVSARCVLLPRAPKHAKDELRRRAGASLRFAERAEAASYTSDAARAASDKNASVNRAASPASSRFASARSYRRVPAYTLAACAALAVCDATRNARDRASTRAAIFRTSATHRSAPTSSSKKVGTASSSRYAAAHPATASANRSAAAPVPATSAARLGAASSAARSAADAAAADARAAGAGSAFSFKEPRRSRAPRAS